MVMWGVTASGKLRASVATLFFLERVYRGCFGFREEVGTWCWSLKLKVWWLMKVGVLAVVLAIKCGGGCDDRKVLFMESWG